MNFFLIANPFKKLAHNDQIKLIFDELKEQKLIDNNRNLIAKTGREFYARPSNNDITYDPCVSGLSDNSIRFFLLHEEGHHVKGHYGFYLKSVLVIIGLFLFAFPPLIGIVSLLSNTESPIPFFEIILLTAFGSFLFCFSTSLSVKSLEMDEYVSDVFAAKLLRDYYFIEKPSEVVKLAFHELERSREKIEEKKLWTVQKIWVALQEYHPTHTQRIDYVKNLVDQ
jgi:Zn-dependent protease with chaperone function